jgi:outer membrane receptor protein involved in Fe transport
MRLFFRVSAPCLSMSLLSAPALAGERMLDELMQLDMEELMVSVASKRDERPSDATGVISVITAEEIHNFGGRNLAEILDRIPSMQYVSGAFLSGGNASSLRASSWTSVNNHMLWMIDGRPVRDGYVGGYLTDLLQLFPVERIRQIEVIRGPGSALYGTNAMAGAINIITTKPGKAEEYDFSLSGGTGDYRKATGTGGWRDGEDYATVTAVSQAENGWYRRYSTTTGEQSDNEHFGGEQLYAQGRYGNFSALAMISRADVTGTPPSSGSAHSQLSRRYLDVGYTQELPDGWSLETHGTLHNLEDKGWQHYTGRSMQYMGETTLRGRLSDRLHLTSGGVMEYVDGRLSDPLDSGYYFLQYSLYSQLDFQATDWLSLSGGFQWNERYKKQEDVVPRLGAVAHFTDHTGLKLLFGEAFRNVFGAGISSNTPTLRSDPDTAPEKIRTYDAQLFYDTPELYLAGGYFHSRMKNLIGIDLNRSPATITNLDEVRVHGLEAEGKWHAGDGWFLTGSAMYQQNKSGRGVHGRTWTPELMLKGGVSYDPPGEPWHAGVFTSWYDQAADPQDINPRVRMLNPQPDAYHLLSFSAGVSINDWLRLKHRAWDAEFLIYADNLLDEDVWFPETDGAGYNTMPVHSGRNITGTLRIRF